MSINVTCDCGKAFSVRDELLGRKGKCPSCGDIIWIGNSGSEEASQTPRPKRAKAPRQQREARPRTRSANQRQTSSRRQGSSSGSYAPLFLLLAVAAAAFAGYRVDEHTNEQKESPVPVLASVADVQPIPFPETDHIEEMKEEIVVPPTTTKPVAPQPQPQPQPQPRPQPSPIKRELSKTARKAPIYDTTPPTDKLSRWIKRMSN